MRDRRNTSTRSRVETTRQAGTRSARFFYFYFFCNNKNPNKETKRQLLCVVFTVTSNHYIIDQFQYTKVQPKTIDLSARLWEITTVSFIPQSLELRSIVLG